MRGRGFLDRFILLMEEYKVDDEYARKLLWEIDDKPQLVRFYILMMDFYIIDKDQLKIIHKLSDAALEKLIAIFEMLKEKKEEISKIDKETFSRLILNLINAIGYVDSNAVRLERLFSVAKMLYVYVHNPSIYYETLDVISDNSSDENGLNAIIARGCMDASNSKGFSHDTEEQSVEEFKKFVSDNCYRLPETVGASAFSKDGYQLIKERVLKGRFKYGQDLLNQKSIS